MHDKLNDNIVIIRLIIETQQYEDERIGNIETDNPDNTNNVNRQIEMIIRSTIYNAKTIVYIHLVQLWQL